VAQVQIEAIGSDRPAPPAWPASPRRAASPVPAGLTQAQAEALSVFHFDETTGTWVREPTTLDWAHHQLVATVTHFSLFTLGLTCVDAITKTLCYNDSATAVISLVEPTGLDTLKVHDNGSGSFHFGEDFITRGKQGVEVGLDGFGGDSVHHPAGFVGVGHIFHQGTNICENAFLVRREFGAARGPSTSAGHSLGRMICFRSG